MSSIYGMSQGISFPSSVTLQCDQPSQCDQDPDLRWLIVKSKDPISLDSTLSRGAKQKSQISYLSDEAELAAANYFQGMA